ncbi:MAG: Asp/Glu racemase [Acetobacteraceae bacterium]|nr:Asp/Glu racemase [Acetobacteraceae bacterium]
MDIGTASLVDLGVLPCALDEGVASRAAVGLIVLATDQTMEHEFRQAIRLPGVGLFHARLYNSNEITPETLRAMQPLIAPAAELILPGMPLDVVAFGCTSASMTLGEEAVFAEIRRARPEVACTTPVTAALAACRALGATRIGVLTPYSAAVNRTVRAYLEGRGLEVAAFATFDKEDDREVARISPSSIEDAVVALAHSTGLDAVFVSCTSLRLCERVAAIEARAGLPVTSSDHALAWHCLRLAGVDDKVPGMGRLFELALS